MTLFDAIWFFFMMISACVVGVGIAAVLISGVIVRKLKRDIDMDKRCPLCKQEVLDR